MIDSASIAAVNCHAVILAGGSGTRLWPISRKAKPKFLLSLDGKETLLQASVSRLSGLVPPQNIWIVAGESLLPVIREHLSGFPVCRFLAEPAARNTTAAIGWSADKIRHQCPDAVMTVFPADHIIKPKNAFCRTVEASVNFVTKNQESLITIGIKPEFPAATYGYIERGEKLESAGIQAFRVKRFCEKPALPVAEKFLQTGNFYWNTGIFAWKAETVSALIRRFEPEIGEQLDRIAAAAGTPDELNVTKKAFEMMKSVSVDYAVLERAESVIVLESPFEWDDAGTWSVLDRIHADKKDADGNIAVNTSFLAVNSSGCTVWGNDPQHMIALVGLKNVAVIQTDDAVLIVSKDQEESVRETAAKLTAKYH